MGNGCCAATLDASSSRIIGCPRLLLSITTTRGGMLAAIGVGPAAGVVAATDVVTGVTGCIGGMVVSNGESGCNRGLVVGMGAIGAVAATC
jgi:hypothetical protein